jgi:hypothetical protein
MTVSKHTPPRLHKTNHLQHPLKLSYYYFLHFFSTVIFLVGIENPQPEAAENLSDFEKYVTNHAIDLSIYLSIVRI